MKTKRMMITMMLLVCCIAVVGGIYTVLQPKNIATDEELANNESKPIAEIIETEEPVEVEEIVTGDKEVVTEEADKEDTVVVEEIVVTEEKADEIEKEEKVVVEVPMPKVPDTVPETKDDVTDMSKEPEYEEEQVTYQDEKKEEPPKVDIEEKEDSNLVPDSQNPFLNPNNAGDPDIREGEDFYENGVPAGQGDKF